MILAQLWIVDLEVLRTSWFENNIKPENKK